MFIEPAYLSLDTINIKEMYYSGDHNHKIGANG
jgi:hypothetical protein